MSRAVFVLMSTQQNATMIVSRLDYDPIEKIRGVGLDLLELGRRDIRLSALVCRLAMQRRQHCGDGIVVIDGGANIGSFTVEWARFMEGWGEVIAFEPQRWPFYALCGNLAINNCFNARAFNQALVEKSGEVAVPYWRPDEPRNFGGMSLESEAPFSHLVTSTALDDRKFERLDIIKLDLEGGELTAIRGARQTISRLKPIIIAEAFICTPEAIIDLLPDYAIVSIGPDVLCVHKDDSPTLHKEIEQLAEHLNAKQVR